MIFKTVIALLTVPSENQNTFTGGLEVDWKENKMYIPTVLKNCVLEMKKEGGETSMGKGCREGDKN